MTIEQQILEKIAALPEEKRKQVLEYVSKLQIDGAAKSPKKSLEGLCADLNIHITEGDIAEARREMWGNFPRDIAL